MENHSTIFANDSRGRQKTWRGNDIQVSNRQGMNKELSSSQFYSRGMCFNPNHLYLRTKVQKHKNDALASKKLCQNWNCDEILNTFFFTEK